MSDAQERTFKASDRRLKEVRKQGRLSRSQDLQAWIGLGAAVLTLPVVAARAREGASAALANLVDVARHPDPAAAVQVLFDALRAALSAMLPMFAVAVVAVVAVAVAQGGVHLRSLKPIDTATLVKSVQKTKRLLTFDQSYYTLCPGAEVISRVAENVDGARYKRIAFPDAPPPASPEMFTWMRPNAGHIVAAAKKVVG